MCTIPLYLYKSEIHRVKIKLSVFNIDTTDLEKSKHGSLFPNIIRSIILGSSGCEKTNLIYFMFINENSLRFKNVYIYFKTLEQK